MKTVRLNDAACRLLESWLTTKCGPHVFYNWSTRVCFVDLSAGLRKACKAAGLSGITWHHLRRDV